MWHDMVSVSLHLTQMTSDVIDIIIILTPAYATNRSLGWTWLPYDIRVHISWTVLTLVGILTYYSSTRLNPADYEKSKFVSREDDIAQDDEACVTHRCA